MKQKKEIEISYWNKEIKRAELPLLNGLIHGTARYWYKTGIMEDEVEFKKNLWHGQFKSWHEDGAWFDATTYKDGMTHGVELIFYYRKDYKNGNRYNG